MYCDSCDALVPLKFGAGVRLLSLSRDTVPGESCRRRYIFELSYVLFHTADIKGARDGTRRAALSVIVGVVVCLLFCCLFVVVFPFN